MTLEAKIDRRDRIHTHTGNIGHTHKRYDTHRRDRTHTYDLGQTQKR